VSQRCRRTAAVTATVRASGDPAWRMGAVSDAVAPTAAAAAAVAAWVSAWNSRQAVARAHRPLVYRLPAVGAPPRGGCVGRRRAVGGPGGPAALWRTCDRRPRQRATGARRHDGGARQTNRPLVHLAARDDPVFGVDHPACLGKPPSARTSAASRSDSASASTAPTRASQLRATPPTGGHRRSGRPPAARAVCGRYRRSESYEAVQARGLAVDRNPRARCPGRTPRSQARSDSRG